MEYDVKMKYQMGKETNKQYLNNWYTISKKIIYKSLILYTFLYLYINYMYFMHKLLIFYLQKNMREYFLKLWVEKDRPGVGEALGQAWQELKWQRSGYSPKVNQVNRQVSDKVCELSQSLSFRHSCCTLHQSPEPKRNMASISFTSFFQTHAKKSLMAHAEPKLCKE